MSRNCKSLFTKNTTQIEVMKKFSIYLNMPNLESKNEKMRSKDVIVEVNLDKSTNRISPVLYDLIKEKNQIIVWICLTMISSSRPKIIPFLKTSRKQNYSMKKTAEEFLIKPIHKVIDVVNIVKSDIIIPKELVELQRIDLHYHKITRILNLSKARLRPTNYFNELDKFITLHGNYNPVFQQMSKR